MVNAAKRGELRCEDPRKIEKIYKTYIVDEYQDNERKVKLKPIKNDMRSFDSLIYEEPEGYVKDSNVTCNYEFFYDILKTCDLTLEDIFESIKKLVVIDIRLERDDDAQLIFESLNSTGLSNIDNLYFEFKSFMESCPLLTRSIILNFHLNLPTYLFEISPFIYQRN